MAPEELSLATTLLPALVLYLVYLWWRRHAYKPAGEVQEWHKEVAGECEEPGDDEETVGAKKLDRAPAAGTRYYLGTRQAHAAAANSLAASFSPPPAAAPGRMSRMIPGRRAPR